jgi:membrane protease YdiL (CAAX protease family)
MGADRYRTLYDRHSGVAEGLLAVALVVAAHVVGGLASVALTELVTGGPLGPGATLLEAGLFWTAVVVGLYGVGFFGVGWASLRYRGLADELLVVSVPDRGSIRPLAVAVGGGLLALLATDALSHAATDYSVVRFSSLGSVGGVLTPLDVALAVLVAAPAMEVLYRGAVQGTIERVAGPATAIGVGAGLYALAGAWFAGGGAAALLVVAALWVQGGLAGYAYDETGNLAVPVVSTATFLAAVHLLYLLPWAA